MNSEITVQTIPFISASAALLIAWLSILALLHRAHKKVHAKAKLEIESYRRENNAIKAMLARMPGVPCIYCGLEDMSKCKSGFPGCAKMDDVMVGDEEHTRELLEENRRLKQALVIADPQRTRPDKPVDESTH